VFDADSAGFWPGEGCGMVVLMRHEDALARLHAPRALVRGWGISSDGHGGITRPQPEGQFLALRRAYERAGYGIDSVAYFEGHGTGTAVGDAAELRALNLARSRGSPAAIGSVKANIGHTKAAAGVAGLIKTSLCAPTTGCWFRQQRWFEMSANCAQRIRARFPLILKRNESTGGGARRPGAVH